MVKRLLFLAAVLFASSAGAQDLHFTQFHMSPLTLNPAFTGVFNGNMRLTANYRNQWQSILPTVPFRTFAGAVELSGRSGPDNRIGFGLHVFSDEAGSLNLSKTQVSGSLAYTMALSRNKDYYLSAGFQANYNTASFDYLKITTGNQFIEGVHDNTAPTGEAFSYGSTSYIDAGLGILWYHIRSIRSYQYIGGSAFHVNRPNMSFLDNSVDKMYAKYVVHAGAGFKLGPRFDMVPHLLAMTQGPSFEVNTGVFGKFILDERKTSAFGGTAFYIGPFYRIVGDNRTSVGHDAIILATKLDVNAITIGLSYDINISGLVPASSGRGGPELAIQYIANFNGKRTKTFCPKF